MNNTSRRVGGDFYLVNQQVKDNNKVLNHHPRILIVDPLNLLFCLCKILCWSHQLRDLTTRINLCMDILTFLVIQKNWMKILIFLG